ncbi:hypothetical protein KW850_25270 [Bacillus sp. sid0103]|uniref:hypothetical protein n=1 Tax=Bacillus sp. sid0103 TaxID=2856337 RepID=UPI001C45768C|nr:hypothetical protein [Bacillus sp. sid0103]MBV7508531.1 hypothetical protein [Bacillus sp. sid0103]
MDKANLFGLYDFVNFHICKSLLNKGVEVIGVHLEEPDNQSFLEEKRFEVGRNANLLEQSIFEWEILQEKEENDTCLIISIFDLFMSKKEHILQDKKVTKRIIEYLVDSKNVNNTVFILPIQMLTKTFKGQEIEEFLSLIKGLGKNTQFIYLPAVYGPWQSSAFLFQKVMVSKYQEINITNDEREWTDDALFINDALESILEIIEKGKSGSYLLESGRNNYWSSCADYLNIPEHLVSKNRAESLLLNSDIKTIAVKKVTPMMKSIQEQLEQVQRLYANRL